MELKTLLCLVLCVVFVKTNECENTKSVKEVKRFKRAKYYSSPPPGAIKYYRRPPSYSFPKGVFSPTPPPNYMMEDEVPSYPQPGLSYPSRPPFVSKKPTNDGLGDEDISNIIKYLSKEDLDKIIEFSGHKESVKKNKIRYFDNSSDEKFSLNGPFVSATNDRPNTNYPQGAPQKSTYNDASHNINNAFANSALDTEESRYEVTYTNNKFANQAFNSLNDKDINEQEVLLPRPVNLREDNIVGEFTSNLENVARPFSNYKLENFGDLPIMNYHHSKQFKTDSYSVPHYSITSHPVKPQSVKVEPAPHRSTALAQSDAHLQAIKIWTHKSAGQAYTLHDDGSLSAERPLRPKPVYGP